MSSIFYEKAKKKMRRYMEEHPFNEMPNPKELMVFLKDQPTYISVMAYKAGRITKEELLKYAKEREQEILAKKPEDRKGHTKEQWEKLKELHLV